MTDPGTLPRSDVLGTRVTACTFAEAVAALEARVEAGRPAVFSAATVHSVMTGRRDPPFREAVNRADLVMADGMPLVWAARRDRPDAERVHGDDLLLHVVRRHPEWRHALLGGAPGQPDAVADELRRRVPDVQVVVARATPVRPVPDAGTAAALEAIREAEAEVVWVGMGTPHQDRWMAAHREAAGVPLVAVGSAFDLLSGRKRPAPAWLRGTGLEWLHRLVQEPVRLGPRYLRDNPAFLARFAAQLVRERRRRG